MQYDPRERVICAQQVCWLPLDRISPRQNMPFGREDSASLSELAESIRRDGLIVPITVQRQAGGRYQVVSGNRRLMACRMAGLTHIDAVVLSGMAEAANVRQLLDGVRSGRLHYLEEADALSALRQDYALSAEDIARSLGCTAATVEAKARLAALDAETRACLLETRLPERYAQMLLRLPDRRERVAIAHQAAAQHLSVRDTELLVASAARRLAVPPPPGRRTITLMRDHRPYLNAIRAIVAQMRDAGLPVISSERELSGEVEVLLRLPTRKRRAALPREHPAMERR